MESKIENCLYMQVAHCNKCGGQSGYNIVDGEKVCFDCGEPYEADFSVSKVESTITTTNSQDQEEWEKEFELPDEIEHEDCIEVLADKHKLWEICSWEEPELDPDKVVAFIKQLLEERECRAREEWTEELRQAFYDTFYKSGELWFDYLFEDGDTEAEEDAKAVVEGYWEDILSELKDKN